MEDLDQLRRPENLCRAWRWLRSNADAAYKSCVRSLNQRFVMAEAALLDDLSGRNLLRRAEGILRIIRDQPAILRVTFRQR